MAGRSCTVFYSWQTDTPSNVNRSFIEKALRRAAKAIRSDESILVEPVVDRDTVGVPGAPDIFNTILEKIASAEAFVCDVTIIGQQGKRPTPNPNVLVELGYALGVLGEGRILMVMNTAYGDEKELPFDLQKRRLAMYHLPEAGDDRSAELKRLESSFKVGLKTILSEVPAEAVVLGTPMDQAVAGVGEHQGDGGAAIQSAMDWLLSELDRVSPSYDSSSELDDQLLDCLKDTIPLALSFSRLCDLTAARGTDAEAFALYSTFDRFLTRYNPRRGFSGSYMAYDFDVFRFVGHELFVMFFASLLQRGRWSLIGRLLDDGLYWENSPEGSRRMADFHELNEHVVLLEQRKRRLNLNSISIRADVLNERHTDGDLGAAAPMQAFADADYLLFLRSEVGEEADDWGIRWYPWSAIYMDHTPPRYMVEAEYRKGAQRLLEALGIPDIDTLRTQVAAVVPRLNRSLPHSAMPRNFLHGIDPMKLGSK